MKKLVPPIIAVTIAIAVLLYLSMVRNSVSCYSSDSFVIANKIKYSDLGANIDNKLLYPFRWIVLRHNMRRNEYALYLLYHVNDNNTLALIKESLKLDSTPASKDAFLTITNLPILEMLNVAVGDDDIIFSNVANTVFVVNNTLFVIKVMDE